MKEIRCTKCNKLLGKYTDTSDRVYGETTIEIKCPRCKEKNVLELQ